MREGSVPALEPGVCQVWWASPEDVGPEHDALLGHAELERRSRLRLDGDRRRLTAGAAVVRQVLGVHTGTRPADLRIDRTCPECGEQHGKPWLPDAPDLHFSVAHSGGAVVVAVLRGSRVGVDVEEVGRYAPEELDELVRDTLAPEERAEVLRLPISARPRAFTTYWARKEAVLKATGQGLAEPLAELVVSPPSSPPSVLRWTDRLERLSLQALHAPPGFVGALAVVGAPPLQVDERDAGPLLGQTSRRLPGATTRSQRYP